MSTKPFATLIPAKNNVAPVAVEDAVEAAERVRTEKEETEADVAASASAEAEKHRQEEKALAADDEK